MMCKENIIWDKPIILDVAIIHVEKINMTIFMLPGNLCNDNYYFQRMKDAEIGMYYLLV